MGQVIKTTPATRAFLREDDAAGMRSYIGVYSTSEISGILNSYQAADSDLSAIAALTTTAFGRSFLTLADDVAARALIGTSSTAWNDISGKPTTLAGYNISDALTAVQIAAAYQPLDADLTAIAALSTAAYGRSLLTLADQAALQTAYGATIASSLNQTYSDTITWTGTTAPSGTATHRYSWFRIGKLVFFTFRFEWTSAGTGITRAELPFPSGMPAPESLGNQGNSEVVCMVNGGLGATGPLGSSANLNTSDSRIQLDSSGNPILWVRAASTAINGMVISGCYLCA